MSSALLDFHSCLSGKVHFLVRKPAVLVKALVHAYPALMLVAVTHYPVLLLALLVKDKIIMTKDEKEIDNLLKNSFTLTVSGFSNIFSF